VLDALLLIFRLFVRPECVTALFQYTECRSDLLKSSRGLGRVVIWICPCAEIAPLSLSCCVPTNQRNGAVSVSKATRWLSRYPKSEQATIWYGRSNCQTLHQPPIVSNLSTVNRRALRWLRHLPGYPALLIRTYGRHRAVTSFVVSI
jgi:hypothetical protein